MTISGVRVSPKMPRIPETLIISLLIDFSPIILFNKYFFQFLNLFENFGRNKVDIEISFPNGIREKVDEN